MNKANRIRKKAREYLKEIKQSFTSWEYDCGYFIHNLPPRLVVYRQMRFIKADKEYKEKQAAEKAAREQECLKQDYILVKMRNKADFEERVGFLLTNGFVESSDLKVVVQTERKTVPNEIDYEYVSYDNNYNEYIQAFKKINE